MPDIVVEDGTGLATANSYASQDEYETYCDNNGLTFDATDSDANDQALIRATAALDATYRGQYPGYRVNGRDQALEWPRTSAYDYEGLLVASDEVPTEIAQATIEMAVRERASPGSMLPDLERGGAISRLKAGSVEIDYAANATTVTTFQIIDGILSSLLSSSPSSTAAVSVRG